ncbi:MAG: proton-conducting transporter membrane subunit, partial [Bdellovibrionia bacterium]
MDSISLFLIPALPLGSAFLLGVLGRKLPNSAVAILGAGSIGLSALFTILLGVSFLASPPQGYAYSQTLFTWIQSGNFRAEIAFRYDALSLIMTSVVSIVSFLIHIYSIEFMEGEDGYSRFFSYMNLFVASMLTLVLADNLLLLYLGWEGVGFCSYLLIGFWYKDSLNGRAARKAFIVTRIGDT